MRQNGMMSSTYEYVYNCIYACLYTCLDVGICVCVCVFVCRYVRASMHAFVCLSGQSLYLCVYMTVNTSLTQLHEY